MEYYKEGDRVEINDISNYTLTKHSLQLNKEYIIIDVIFDYDGYMKYTITNDKGTPTTLAYYSLKYSISHIRDCSIDEILK